jgi:hypothetical protein
VSGTRRLRSRSGGTLMMETNQSSGQEVFSSNEMKGW